MKECIEQALKEINYTIIEDANIVATVHIHNESFQFGIFETFKYYGLSLDNLIRKPNGDIYLIISKEIGFPEFNRCLLLSASSNSEHEGGYQTVQLTAIVGERSGQFEIPNYQSPDFSLRSILDTMLQQIVISRSDEWIQSIIEEFNPFIVKGKGFNPKIAKLYINDLTRTAIQNTEELIHLFNQETVEGWIEEQHEKMNFIKTLKEYQN